MPASLDPIERHEHGEVVVYLQRLNCRASTHCTADNFRALFTPLEMALPLLATGVKEPRSPTGYGVSAMRSVAFEPITQRTRQPQVLLIVTPATGAGFDMLNVQGFVDIVLMRSTITTAIARLRNKTRP